VSLWISRTTVVHRIFTSAHKQFCPALQMQMGVLITLTAAACIGDLSSKEAIGFSTLEANFMGNQPVQGMSLHLRFICWASV
jgi:hypothetical protein